MTPLDLERIARARGYAQSLALAVGPSIPEGVRVIGRAIDELLAEIPVEVTS